MNKKEDPGHWVVRLLNEMTGTSKERAGKMLSVNLWQQIREAQMC